MSHRIGTANDDYSTSRLHNTKHKSSNVVFGLDFMVRGTGIEPVRISPRDFKSLVSANFTTRAILRYSVNFEKVWSNTRL